MYHAVLLSHAVISYYNCYRISLVGCKQVKRLAVVMRSDDSCEIG